MADTDFDRLLRWSQMDAGALGAAATDENLELMSRIVDQLCDEEAKRHIVIDKANFPSLVQEMQSLVAEGSRSLSKTIIAAQRLLDSGEKEKARDVYREFLERCHSPFYQRMASGRLQQIR